MRAPCSATCLACGETRAGRKEAVSSSNHSLPSRECHMTAIWVAGRATERKEAWKVDVGEMHEAMDRMKVPPSAAGERQEEGVPGQC